MKIVIDIDVERFKDIQRIAKVQLERKHFQTVEQFIAKGTPLPKGHGRLIDADELYNSLKFPTQQFALAFKQVLDDAPTIIEADKEGEEE